MQAWQQNRPAGQPCPCRVYCHSRSGALVVKAVKAETRPAPANGAERSSVTHSLSSSAPYEPGPAAPVRILEPISYADLYGSGTYGGITSATLWNRLSPLLWYLPSDEQRHQVQQALEVAFAAHSGQKRKSGEPFITHPVEVARILAEMRMDHESVIAGLLHDTVEDTDAITFDDIEVTFGAAVRRIVEGETKISKITRCSSDTDEKAKDLQGLFLAMTNDVRIILVKLADRLHNMRTLYGMKREKQIKIGLETLQVFAPLAKLLGVYCIKEELEELSLQYVEPELYNHIKRWQDKQAKEQQPSIDAAKHDLEALLNSDSYLQGHARSFSVRMRPRTVYAIYKQLMSIARGAAAAEAGASADRPASSSSSSSSGRDGNKGTSSTAASTSADERAASGASATTSSGTTTSTSSSSSGGGSSSSSNSSSCYGTVSWRGGAGAGSNGAAARAAAHQRQTLLAHLKDVPERGVVLQVVMEELQGPVGPSFVMESHQLCYYVLGLVHSIWSPIPGALKDFIGSPKTNGYQSLHTTVVPLSILSKNCSLVPMEVQIRTADMDRLAELGVAASNWVAKAPRHTPGAPRRTAPSTNATSTLATTNGTSSHSSNGSSGAVPIIAATSGSGAAPGANGSSSNGAGSSKGTSTTATGSSSSSSSSSSVSTSSANAIVAPGVKKRMAAVLGSGMHGVEPFDLTISMDSSTGSSGSSSSSSRGASSAGSSASSANGAAKGRNFWMNLASFMLESLAAGTNGVAAFTGAAAATVHPGSNGKAASPSGAAPAAGSAAEDSNVAANGTSNGTAASRGNEHDVRSSSTGGGEAQGSGHERHGNKSNKSSNGSSNNGGSSTGSTYSVYGSAYGFSYSLIDTNEQATGATAGNGSTKAGTAAPNGTSSSNGVASSNSNGSYSAAGAGNGSSPAAAAGSSSSNGVVNSSSASAQSSSASSGPDTLSSNGSSAHMAPSTPTGTAGPANAPGTSIHDATNRANDRAIDGADTANAQIPTRPAAGSRESTQHIPPLVNSSSSGNTDSALGAAHAPSPITATRTSTGSFDSPTEAATDMTGSDISTGIQTTTGTDQHTGNDTSTGINSSIGSDKSVATGERMATDKHTDTDAMHGAHMTSTAISASNGSSGARGDGTRGGGWGGSCAAAEATEVVADGSSASAGGSAASTTSRAASNGSQSDDSNTDMTATPGIASPGIASPGIASPGIASYGTTTGHTAPATGTAQVATPAGMATAPAGMAQTAAPAGVAETTAPSAPTLAFMPGYAFQSTGDSNWLTQMRKWSEDFLGSLSAREFVDGVTAEVLGQSVFVYTHTGELRRLPKGSTVVDFAYSVHTSLGNEMTVALVNGRFVPPSYVLSNGEVVEIKRDSRVTASGVRRHEQWASLVATKTAKLKLRAFVREHAHLLAPVTEVDAAESMAWAGAAAADDVAAAARAGVEAAGEVAAAAKTDMAAAGDVAVVAIEGAEATDDMATVPKTGVNKAAAAAGGVADVAAVVAQGPIAGAGAAAERVAAGAGTASLKSGPAAVPAPAEPAMASSAAGLNRNKMLRVSCEDRKGIMAAVCSTISVHDHNIESAVAAPAAAGFYQLEFRVEGDDMHTSSMLSSIAKLDGVCTASCSSSHGAA